MDVNKAVMYSRSHAHGPSGHCARFTREAIEAGGVTLIHHVSAKDYGSSLTLAGFRAIPSNGSYLPGDVAIIQPIPGHPDGHMAMFDGTHWISDFVQPHGLYPSLAYREAKPAYTIYRPAIVWTGPDGVQSGNLV